MVAGSGGVCEGEQLQEVVGGADHGPFGTHFLDAAQQELAEAACLFDLSEHRFHHLLSQSVGRFEAAIVDLLSHPLGQRSADFSVLGCRVLGTSGRDIAVDTVCFQRCEIGFAAVTGVRRGLRWLAAEIILDGLDQGHQLALIVATLLQFVRDNDLGACVNGGLCVIGLIEAILRLHDAAFRIGEVALRLGIGLVRRRCRRFARLLAAFGLALLFLFGLDTTLFLRLQLGVRLQRRHRLLDLRQPLLLVADPIRHLVAALVFAESLVLLGIRRLGGRQHAGDLGLQFRLALLHASITHRFVFRRVRFDLRAIQRDVAEFDQPCRLAQLQNLQEQRTECLQMPLAEVANCSDRLLADCQVRTMKHIVDNLLPFLICAGTILLFNSSPGYALDQSQAIENCRSSSGKPAYAACKQGGGTHEACFGKAKATVQSCVRSALIAARPKAALFSAEKLSQPASQAAPSAADVAKDASASLVAPPRTISDISAILDQQKPDPAVIAKLTETADAAV